MSGVKITYGGNGLGTVVTAGLDRDIIVLLKVDTSVLAVRVLCKAEELPLGAGVARTHVVLVVLPVATGLVTAGIARVIAAVAVATTTVRTALIERASASTSAAVAETSRASAEVRARRVPTRKKRVS